MRLTNSEKDLFNAIIKYFDISEKDRQVFLSRWCLFLKVLTVLVASFRLEKLEVKYRNFMSYVGDISIMLFKNTEKHKKYEKSLKPNKKMKKLSAAKQDGKNKRKNNKKHYREKYHYMSGKVSEIEALEKARPLSDDEALRLIRFKSEEFAARVNFFKITQSRASRRKSGLDPAYRRRQERRAALHRSEGKPKDDEKQLEEKEFPKTVSMNVPTELQSAVRYDVMPYFYASSDQSSFNNTQYS